MTAKLQAIIAILVLSAFAIALPATGLGGHGRVGGRTKIEDVESNKEIQDLGKYSVDQYNLQQRGSGEKGSGDLKFLKVVAAEEQVVAGIKYYLKIAAATNKGKKKTFDAEVVVQAWKKKSKQLLNFSPSPPN